MQSSTVGAVTSLRPGRTELRNPFVPVHTAVIAAVLVCALPLVAASATRFVANTGTDGPNCGVDALTACRSITQAIALAAPDDTIIVGPGRYGDLNFSGTLGDIPGEETGSPGCSCVLSMNKNVFILSSAGAATTMIDGTTVNVVQTVVVLSVGGEFGRPGKGFTVTETGRRDSNSNSNGHGIGIDAENVKVRGNQVMFMARGEESIGTGVFIVNDAAVLIEGNHVSNWFIGIDVRGGSAAILSKNQVIGNQYGIRARGGRVVGNVITRNFTGVSLYSTTTAVSNAVYANVFGFAVGQGFSGVFTRNNMFGQRMGCGLSNQEVVGLQATNNYWGAVTGPGAAPADKVCNGTGATTATSPFATKPFAVTILKP